MGLQDLKRQHHAWVPIEFTFFHVKSSLWNQEVLNVGGSKDSILLLNFSQVCFVELVMCE